MAYTTVTDECPFIRFSGNTLEDVVVEKSKVKLELVGTTINVVFISGGAQIISWNEAQALEYGYTPTSLYSYILGILKVQCGGGGGGIDSVQAGTNIIIDNSDPSNPIINATFSQEGKYLISGGAAWSGTGLTYDVTALTYFFNGNKISLATQVTLAVADPTNNRLDAIVVDEAGVVSVIQGTASVNPITPPIPEEQLLVQYILVEDGLASPSVSNENIYLDDPAGSWTLSTYTTGAPTGTLVFNGTTSPKEGINHIQADADQRLGARFVRATSFDAFQYTVLQVWVRFTGTNVDSNKSLNVRFENSVGTLVGNTLNLFNYGIQRNVLNTWQLAVIPITAFGSLPSTVKGFRAIMIGGTVGVTRQWDMDWIHLSDTSVLNVEVPKINFYKDDVAVASQSGLNLKAGANIGITAVEDALNNRVDYIITSLGGAIPVSSLTAATGTNTINNANYKQTWQWNSLSSGIGLELSSSSTGATSNTQTVFAINQTGANATASQTTYGALFSNTKTGTSSTNIAAKFSASGATNNYAAIFENGNVGIGTTSPSAKLDVMGSSDFLGLQVGNGTVGTLFQIYGGKAGFVGFSGSAYNNLDIRCGASTQLFLSTNGNVGIADANPTQRLSINGALCFSGVSAPSENVAIYAPYSYTLGFMTNGVERMRINGNGDVGVGTTSPSASALLDLTSTTKGFLPPRMTATQASAIPSPAEGLILYVFDTNGTFATKGWYGFDGATWNKLN